MDPRLLLRQYPTFAGRDRPGRHCVAASAQHPARLYETWPSQRPNVRAMGCPGRSAAANFVASRASSPVVSVFQKRGGGAESDQLVEEFVRISSFRSRIYIDGVGSAHTHTPSTTSCTLSHCSSTSTSFGGKQTHRCRRKSSVSCSSAAGTNQSSQPARHRKRRLCRAAGSASHRGKCLAVSISLSIRKQRAMISSRQGRVLQLHAGTHTHTIVHSASQPKPARP